MSAVALWLSLAGAFFLNATSARAESWREKVAQYPEQLMESKAPNCDLSNTPVPWPTLVEEEKSPAQFGTCEPTAQTYPLSEGAKEVLSLSNEMWDKGLVYDARGAGEEVGGEPQLDADPLYANGVDCITKIEAVFDAYHRGYSTVDVCPAHSPSKYLPGMDKSFFGRAHYYETQWRPNLINRGIVRDVTACLPKSFKQTCVSRRDKKYNSVNEYRFEMDYSAWRGVMKSSFKNHLYGMVFLSDLDEKLYGEAVKESGVKDIRKQVTTARQERDASCMAMWRQYVGVRKNWPVQTEFSPFDKVIRNTSRELLGSIEDLGQIACQNEKTHDQLQKSYKHLIATIRADVVEGLAASPVVGTVPCVGVRDQKGKINFDPSTDFPKEWATEGQVLFASLISDTKVGTSGKNPLHAHHMGMLIYRNGKWKIRHPSSRFSYRDPKKRGRKIASWKKTECGKESDISGDIIEEPFECFLERSDHIVGMDLLAPN